MINSKINYSNRVRLIFSSQKYFSSQMNMKKNSCMIALGSNIGDRSSNLNQAFKELSKIGKVKSTSDLYQSEPMYHEDQPRFFNAACLIETELGPHQLLSELKLIESKIGREKTFQNGPRVIDLDILFYDDQIVSTDNLLIPHPRAQERSFVLRPLLDIDKTFVHPTIKKTISQLYDELPNSAKEPLKRIIPCFNHVSKMTNHIVLDSGFPIIMGILNVTPDSFSDGGRYLAVHEAIEKVKSLVEDGADIIDIGGESTRPTSTEVDVLEELDRVIPVIRGIREAGINCLISIDTRKSEVAKEAILNGADIINDVSAGEFDPNMLNVVGKLQVPYIAMHMRGLPQTMLQAKHSTYTNVLDEVSNELQTKMNKLNERIPRWLQIIDPGIGFAKGKDENNELLNPQKLLKFKDNLSNRATLIGLSRKRFLNSMYLKIEGFRPNLILNQNLQPLVQRTTSEPIDLETRDRYTAGVCGAALLGGADIFRVHNVKETKDILNSLSFLTTSFKN